MRGKYHPGNGPLKDFYGPLLPECNTACAIESILALRTSVAIRAFHIANEGWMHVAPMGSTNAPGPSVDNAAATDDISQILMQFESLGGSGHGCEFGLVQREFGAEPLGMLRWADLGYDLLVAALESDFEGVGDPANTIVFVPDGNNAHYWSRDRRFWMAQRSHVQVGDMSMELAAEQICRRLQFLKRKLLADLAEGAKVFVYKNILRTLTDDELVRLHAAARRYGDNTLLYVRIEDASHPNGMVEWAGPGLMVGYIDHFTHSPTDEFLGKSTESWCVICRNAYSLWRCPQLNRA